MAEVKKKQEEGSFGSGLLGGLKQIGSDLMDFLQTPEAMQFGAGILNSKSPGIMGAIGDGYQAYQDAKHQNADRMLKRQMQQQEALLNAAKIQEIFSNIQSDKEYDAYARSIMGMGGGTPSSGRGAPTLADYQNANLRFLEAPSGSTKQSEGGNEGFVAPKGMSIEEQVAQGYPVNTSDEEALAADQKKLPIPSQPTTPGQAGGYQQQASFTPQAQRIQGSVNPNIDPLSVLAFKGFRREKKLGEAANALRGEKQNWTLEKVLDRNTGKPMYARYNPQTGQMIPAQGGFSPYEKPEADVRINEIRKSEAKRYEDEVGKFRSAAEASTGMLSKAHEVTAQFLKNPDLQSGPGIEALETLKRGMSMILGAPTDKNRGAQEAVLKSIAQFMPEGGKQLQAAIGSKNGLTNQEMVDIVPLTIMSQANSREGIFEIANMIAVYDAAIQEGYESAQDLYNEWWSSIQAGEDPGFDLNKELHQVSIGVAKRKEKALDAYLDQREKFQNSRKKSK